MSVRRLSSVALRAATSVGLLMLPGLGLAQETGGAKTVERPLNATKQEGGSAVVGGASRSAQDRAVAGRVADLIAKSVRIDNYAPPPKELLLQFLTEAHTCPADKAVVGIEVVNKTRSGDAERRQFDGLLIRCDGFVLLPLQLVSRAMSGGREADSQTIQVTLNPGTPEAKRVPAELNRFTSTRVQMAVLRLKTTHAPAARTLLPDMLKAGNSVEIVWSEFDASTGRFTATKRRTVHLAEPPKDAEERKSQDIRSGEIRFAETLAGVPSGAGVVGPEKMALGILPGSSVRHDRFISMSVLAGVTGCVVPEPTTEEEFARLQKAAHGDEPDPQPVSLDTGTPLGKGANANGSPFPVSRVPAEAGVNEFGKGVGGLGPVSRVPAAFLNPGAPEIELIQNPKSKIQNDMIAIPGGPVKLPLGILTDYHEMTREMVACVPDFKLDRYKVSNREYYGFWIGLPEKERRKPEVIAAYYPISWATTDPPFPAEIDDTPVLGVPLAGAEAYAKSQGKRLPTAYEWCRAAYGPLGDRALPDWVLAYINDRQQAWKRLVVSHIEHIYPLIAADESRNGIANIDNQFRERGSVKPLAAYVDTLPREFTIPLITYNERFAGTAQWSAAQVKAEVAQLCKTWIDPLYVAPRGSRPFDVSPFGVCDMLLNGNERVAAYAEMATSQEFIAPTFIPGIVDQHMLDELGEPAAAAWFTHIPVFGPGLRAKDFKVVEDPMWQIPLLSRRLLASGNRVRRDTNQFSPAYNEAYTEYCEHIFECVQMIRPIADLRIGTLSNDAIDCENWTDGTITFKNVSIANGLPQGYVAEWTAQSVWPMPHGQPLADIYNFPHEAPTHAPTVTSRYEGTMAQFGPAQLDDVFGPWTGRYFFQTAWYNAWAGESKFARREMGRDWDKDPLGHVGITPHGAGKVVQPPDVYLIPNGFRCAR